MYTIKRTIKRSVVIFLSFLTALALFFSVQAQPLTAVFAAADKSSAIDEVSNASGKSYHTDFETFEEEQEASNAFNVEIASEGDVLLKNANGALPLKSYERNVSVFGVRSVDLQYGGGGSGGGDSSSANNLQDSLEDAGLNINPSLTTFYTNYEPVVVSIGSGWSAASGIPQEAPIDLLKTTQDSYELYNDVAILVFSRAGSEGNDLDTHSIPGYEDNTRHELELTELEDELISYVTGLGVFKKVVVLVNASNPMELGKLQYNDKIDSVLWIGHVGTSGIMAVGKILTGEVNPSGRLVDMYPADFSKDPTWYNFGDNSQNHYNAATKEFDDSFINVRSVDDPTKQYRGFLSVDYEEGIYMGYRWYETADAEGYFDKAQAAGAFTAEDAGVKANGGDTYYNTYNGVVYPFGYGLSYTTFDWEITTEGGTWNGKDALTVKVKVTNTGDVAGKDVVQIYSSAPYYEGGIEKAATDLVDYAKTDLLEPGDSQTITFTLTPQQLAAFDDGIWGTDNINGAYVLDPGDYVISARSDSHVVKDSVTFTLGTEAADADEAAENAVAILYDEATGARIQTYFSADDGYNNTVRTTSVSKTDMDVTSRADFSATMTDTAAYPYGLYHPSTATVDDLTFNKTAISILDGSLRAIDGLDSKANNSVSYIDNMGGKGDPSTINVAGNPNNNNTLWVVEEDYVRDLKWTQATEEDVAKRVDGKTAIQLYEMKGVALDDEKWVEFMNQLTYDEMIAVFSSNMFSTAAMEAIGKPGSSEADGPAQLSGGTFWASEVVIASTWNYDLAVKQGWFVGNDSLFLGTNGWYGPGINTHRSPFGGRNFEYYSQDGVQGGKIFAGVVKGAQSKGVHIYSKHFFLNDQEMGRDVYGGICTWVPEQAIRQIYIKVMEEAVKESDLNGTMTAFNRIGMISSANAGTYLGIMEKEFGFNGVSNTDMYQSGEGGSAWSANRLIRAHIYPLGSFSGTNVISGEFRDDADGGMVWITDDVDAEGKTVAAFESPSQWKAVRELAMRALYIAVNNNMMNNGIDTSAFADKDFSFSAGVSASASIAVKDTDLKEDFLVVKYTLADGAALPAGLTLAQDGTISGKSTQVGTYEVGVVMTVDHYITKEATLTISISPAFTLDTSTVAAGAAYNASITSKSVVVGEGAYDTVKYAVTSGALPAGIVLGEDGKFQGSATAAGSYDFTVTVTATKTEAGSSGDTVTTDVFTQDFTIEVTAGEAPAAKTFTLTYSANYDGGKDTKITVNEGDVVKFAANPVREGYIFTGWYTNKDCTASVDPNAAVSADATYYAGWYEIPSGGCGSNVVGTSAAIAVLALCGAACVIFLRKKEAK